MHLDRWIDDHRVPTRVSVWLGFLVFLVLLGLCVHRADAADADLTWTHPTQRVDNTALPIGEIAATRLNWGTCGSALASTVDVPAPATTRKITGLGYGTWCFTARTVDTAGQASDPTGPVQKVIVAPPKPPVLVTVNIVAYAVRRQAGGGAKLARAVGTVALGTACGSNVITRRGTRSYYQVPLDKVDMRRLPNSAILVAECGVQS